ncbi:penicillin-binding protein 1C [Aliidongia dinghuensis]|uniref:peptidoglycan glycosyltransferase n=1 Tax=Aliidongia dinghuensis TaxID=1867774 RepID=A0A8J2YYR7_9PROT|nr:penicillin-binding protein 1C [Aliidongia dinghuensis]GGF42395.1 penicillin-binding protein 1C [Aliidongia dinghuensis]
MSGRLRQAFAALLAVTAGALLLDRLLPPDLHRWQDRSAVLTAHDGTVLNVATTRDGMWRLGTRPDAVDPHYLDMLLAAEDHRFRDHPGIDPLAATRAAWQLIRTGRIVSGGSTLTMQVARLLEPHPRSVLGKLHDAIRAIQLEERYGKDEILAMYLTLAPFGGNVEGVRAASLTWFGHEPDRLTPGEAAILVALPQRPAALRPDRHPARALAAAGRVLDRLVDEGRLPEADRETPPPTIARRYPFQHLAPQVASRLHRSDGEPVRTLIDAGIQRGIEREAADAVRAMTDGGDVAILVVENRELAIRGWVGGVRSALDLARRRRSPGSALKPFIYGLAFDDLALLPETLVEDRPLRIGDYAPENFDRGFHGEVTAREALQQSLNVPAIALLDRLGPGRLAATLRDAGARLDFPAGDLGPSLPLALGGVGISLLDLTRLYVGLAHDGRAAPLRLVPGAVPGEATLMTPHAAREITAILRGSPPPDGRMPRALAAGARPIAYKTGTSYGFRDAWAVGYSPDWTIGVWTGRADGSPRPGAYGRNTAAPLLFTLFDLLPAETSADGPAALAEAGPSTPLPRALERFADRDGLHALPKANPPRILFPPDGAQIDVADETGRLGPLQLEADSGTPPYRWSVNGVPLPSPGLAAPVQWQPDGPGFARVTVTDATGRRTSATIRLR